MVPAELRTERLRLRPPRTDDAQQIFERYAQDPEATRYIGWVTNTDVSETRAYLEKTLRQIEGGGTAAWVIEFEGELAGMISAWGLDGFKVEVGYVLAKGVWGQGLATEATQAVVAALLELDPVQRVQAFCDVDNPASCRVLEKAGLQREGLLRRFGIHPNVSTTIPRDVYAYSRVKG